MGSSGIAEAITDIVTRPRHVAITSAERRPVQPARQQNGEANALINVGDLQQ